MLRNLPTAYRTDPWILALCGAVQILLEELGRETAELAAYTWGQVLEGEMKKAPAQGGG